MVVVHRATVFSAGVAFSYHRRYQGIRAGVWGGDGGNAENLAVWGVRGVHGGARAESGDLCESKHGVRETGVRRASVGESMTSTPLHDRVKVGGTRGAGGGELPGSVDNLKLDGGGGAIEVLI